ncbi:MAG TPA: SusD/RagB family nutrient-binding outer membrane lipoprotein, partial [Chitinophagaceae bacterium]|nr:SusD/RagB family nutrient-binding outer membrane lipoprotein [Chitinophagaceae bacterium]
MKKLLYIAFAALALGQTACTKSDFEEAYPDPSKISNSTVEKQFAGFVGSFREYVIPSYWNYFVVQRTTVNRYSQAVGWVNASGQYVPGGAGITDRWNAFYNSLAQY